MALPEVVTREQWLEARLRLLSAEKEETRRRDALNAERRRLPMVRIAKEYLLEGPQGRGPLAGLWGDSRPLIVQHIIFGPGWAPACPPLTPPPPNPSPRTPPHPRPPQPDFSPLSRPPPP